jgi:hypothetical protein
MAKPHPKGPNRNITRLDYERTRGFWVRFEGAHRTSRLFSDGVHGGKTKALAEARRFRDNWEQTHDLARRISPQSLPGPGRVVRRQIFQRKSWSWVWEAYIRLERGKGHAVTRYSIAKWGSAEAKRLCEAWLKKKQKEQKLAYAEFTERAAPRALPAKPASAAKKALPSSSKKATTKKTAKKAVSKKAPATKASSSKARARKAPATKVRAKKKSSKRS